MRKTLNKDQPLYIQIRNVIEDLIIDGQIDENEQIPSTNELVNFYKINHITVQKGVNQLYEEGILYKKRGIGMFVERGAKEKLMVKRKESFIHDHIVNLVREADKLGISEEDIISLIRMVKERGKDDY